MKKTLDILLFINTLYVLLCADNPDLNVFITPMILYVSLGLLRMYHQEVYDFLTKEQ